MKAKHRWTIDQEAFDLLLSALDADRQRAGEKYEALRRRIVGFFEWRGTASPEDCADEVFDTLARRISEGEPVRNVAAYCAGVARMIYLEKRSGARREMPLAAERVFQTGQPCDEQAAGRVAALEQCLDALPLESQDIILNYYDGQGRERTGARKVLAERLGLAPNALRIRVHRIREQLEDGMKQLLGMADTSRK